MFSVRGAQLLRDNLTLWTQNDVPEQEGGGDVVGTDDANVQDL